jgi:hypothetical protein
MVGPTLVDLLAPLGFTLVMARTETDRPLGVTYIGRRRRQLGRGEAALFNEVTV